MKLFTDLQKGEVFKDLASKSLLEVANDRGLDKKFSTPAQMRWQIRKVYNEVLSNPQKFGVSPDIVALVDKASNARKQTGIRNDLKTVSEKNAEVNPVIGDMDMKELVVGARKKAWILLHRKMDDLLKSPKRIREQAIAPLSILAGTAFDKGRLLEGQSTENFAIKGNIENIEGKTSQELMEFLIKQKELNKPDNQ